MLDTPIQTPAEAPRDLADGIFHRSPDTTLTTLRLAPAARWVVEYYPVEDVREREDGGLDVDLLIADERWLHRLLLRLAPNARVIAPTEFAEAFTGQGTGGAQVVRLTRRTMEFDRHADVRKR